MKKEIMTILAAGALVATCMETSQAAAISWTDWTDKTTSSVSGSLNVLGTDVDVVFSGSYSFAQTTSGGTNYWNPSAPYVSAAVDNAPPASDIIAFAAGGTKTITFSQAVVDPVLALVSWNGNTVDFGVPITILSYGSGYWGSGAPIKNDAGTGFYGSGEVHGVIQLIGAYSSITFTDTSENWHGLTVGVTGLPSSTVPEPSTLLLFGAGLIGLAGSRRGKNKGK